MNDLRSALKNEVLIPKGVPEEELRLFIANSGLRLNEESDKLALAEHTLGFPQKENTIVHRFGPGVYIREAHYSKDSFVCGMYHVGAHINQLLSGVIEVIDGEGKVARLNGHCFLSLEGQ